VRGRASESRRPRSSSSTRIAAVYISCRSGCIGSMAGAGMLWVGWFGFNGGSALAADASAASAILATPLAGSAAGVAWMTLEWTRIGKPTAVGLVTGCVADRVPLVDRRLPARQADRRNIGLARRRRGGE